MGKVIIVDDKRCLSCRQCMIECALAHGEVDTLAEAVAEGVPLQPRLHVEPAGEYGMPMQCRHCQDAPCKAVCPTGAISRASDDEPVLIDQQLCIGCTYCVVACPFGAIDMAREGKAMVKCDLCFERTKAGEAPACVSGCPTGALEYREIDDWIKKRRREAAELLRAADK